MNAGYPILERSAIPGDCEGLQALASRMHAARSDVVSVQRRVASNDLEGVWAGAAAESFRSALAALPRELGSVAAAFEEASGGINGFASRLVELQDRASYYARQITGLEDDRRAAEGRRNEAQAKVDAAHLAHSAASDPISLKASSDALDLAIGGLRLATDDLELNDAEISRLRREAEQNREDYEQAVGTCCATLDRACTGVIGSGGDASDREGKGRTSALAGGPLPCLSSIAHQLEEIVDQVAPKK